ncbi:hypothetical protein HN681_01110 [archaeon]|jgi:hypothetical protein|nr:hypothetical protein [archaeon]MBT3730612.1 hypothetical protein [archaeon]MBT4669514.1 hypothetical protein [archaeon]MBT5030271.1 hypothetical protein [archaeon]MBT5287630.1 hypothetical protein [archaeon]
MKFNYKKIIGASLLIWIVQSIIIMLTCGWLFSWVYEIDPIIWKDMAAMFTLTNTIGMYSISLIGAFLFVIVFNILYKGIPKKGLEKGLVYGFLVWLIAPLVGMASMPFYMTISWIVIIYWLIQALVLYIIKGAIVGYIFKK